LLTHNINANTIIMKVAFLPLALGLYSLRLTIAQDFSKHEITEQKYAAYAQPYSSDL
jgi:hypothetical protein